MYKIEYGTDKRHVADWLGFDVACGTAKGDFSAFCLISQFEEKVLVDAFAGEYKTVTRYQIVDLARTRDLKLDMQVEWMRSYIEKLDTRPIICVDATRELSYCLQLRAALPNHRVYAVVWTGGNDVNRDGWQYNASKTATWRAVKAMTAMQWLTIADLPLKEEVVKEMRNLSIDESDTGYKIIPTSPGVHDDLAFSVATALVPLIGRGILDRGIGARAVPNIMPDKRDVSQYFGKQPGQP